MATPSLRCIFFFFFNDTATPEISPLPLPAALPICWFYASNRPKFLKHLDQRPPITNPRFRPVHGHQPHFRPHAPLPPRPDRKSTRLNSSHLVISYAVFCLKKKNRSEYMPPITTQIT